MTYAQKMMDERRVGYMDGLEDGRAEGMEKGMEKGVEKGVEKGFKDTIIALKDILDPTVIAERFKMSLEQVMDILNQK